MFYCWHLLQSWQELLNFQTLIWLTCCWICRFWPLYLFPGKRCSFLGSQIPSACFFRDLYWLVTYLLIFNLSSSIGLMQPALIYLMFSISTTKNSLQCPQSTSHLAWDFLPFHSQTSEQVISVHFSNSVPFRLFSTHSKLVSCLPTLCSGKRLARWRSFVIKSSRHFSSPSLCDLCVTWHHGPLFRVHSL